MLGELWRKYQDIEQKHFNKADREFEHPDNRIGDRVDLSFSVCDDVTGLLLRISVSGHWADQSNVLEFALKRDVLFNDNPYRENRSIASLSVDEILIVYNLVLPMNRKGSENQIMPVSDYPRHERIYGEIL